VLAREDATGDKQLIAYVTVQPGSDLTPSILREQLLSLLPGYMVPSAFVTLPILPLNANGKVDRQALPAPDASAFATAPYVAPSTPEEIWLAEVWAQTLHLARVGANDDVF